MFSNVRAISSTRVLCGSVCCTDFSVCEKECFTFLSPMFDPLYGRSDVWPTLIR